MTVDGGDPTPQFAPTLLFTNGYEVPWLDCELDPELAFVCGPSRNEGYDYALAGSFEDDRSAARLVVTPRDSPPCVFAMLPADG